MVNMKHAAFRISAPWVLPSSFRLAVIVIAGKQNSLQLKAFFFL